MRATDLMTRQVLTVQPQTPIREDLLEDYLI